MNTDVKSTGTKTNGIGNRTTEHLNLTRTLADVWREEDERARAAPREKLAKGQGG